MSVKTEARVYRMFQVKLTIEVFSPFLEIAPRTPGSEDTGGVKSDMCHGALKIHSRDQWMGA